MTGTAAAPVPERGFPDGEFADRLCRAQDLLARAGLDALLVTQPEDIRYFSGFLTPFFHSPTRPWFLIVPAAGKPVAVIPTIGAELMARSWIEDIRTWAAPDPDDDGVSLLADSLRGIGGDHGRIGLPMGAETALRMPLADFERLRDALAPVRFVDAAPVIRGLRMRKSRREIDKIAHVCALAAGAFAAVPGLIARSATDRALFAAFKIECLRRGVDDVVYLVGGAGRDGYGDVIAPPSGRALTRGDIVMLDTGCVFDGYFCDFDRNFAVGAGSEAARTGYRTLYRATDAGFKAARPGARCADLFAAMHTVLAEAGAAPGAIGRLGHGLGMQLTEPPSIAAFDRTRLEPGMVLTLEPALALGPGRMMVHEENIVVTEDGARLLTPRAPPDLPEIAPG